VANDNQAGMPCPLTEEGIRNNKAALSQTPGKVSDDALLYIKWLEGERTRLSDGDRTDDIEDVPCPYHIHMKPTGQMSPLVFEVRGPNEDAFQRTAIRVARSTAHKIGWDANGKGEVVPPKPYGVGMEVMTFTFNERTERADSGATMADLAKQIAKSKEEATDADEES